MESKIIISQVTSTPAKDTDSVAELYIEHNQEPEEGQSSTATDVNNTAIRDPGVGLSGRSAASCDNSYHGNKDNIKDSKVFRCEDCSFTTVHRKSLYRHKIIHTDKYPFTCPACDYKCRDKLYLKQHLIMKHGEVGALRCEQCSYTTAVKSNLTRHKLCHNDNNPFSCPACNYKCKHKQSLKWHMIVKHGAEGALSCEHCSYSTAFKRDLTKHKLVHSDVYPFICSFCDYKCRQKQSLKHHIVQKHAGENILNVSR